MLASELSLWSDRALLPKRMQLSESDICLRVASDRAVPGRELYRRLRLAGSENKLPVPPRHAKVPVAVPLELLELGIREKIPLTAILEGLSRCLVELCQP